MIVSQIHNIKTESYYNLDYPKELDLDQVLLTYIYKVLETGSDTFKTRNCNLHGSTIEIDNKNLEINDLTKHDTKQIISPVSRNQLLEKKNKSMTTTMAFVISGNVCW